MAVSFSQATVGYISLAASAAISPISVTTGHGDIVVVFETVGRLTTHTPTWSVDSNPISPLRFMEFDDGTNNSTLYAYAVSGLSVGSHTINSVNGSGDGGWTSSRGRIYGATVVSGATMISSGDVAVYASWGSSSSINWTATDIPAEGGALMLGASRRDNGVASVSHTLLGSADSGGAGIQSYSSGALQSYTPAAADSSETLTVTFNSASGRAYVGVVFAPAVEGEWANSLRIGGTAPSKLYYGDTPVTRVYVGATRVYGSAPDD